MTYHINRVEDGPRLDGGLSIFFPAYNDEKTIGQVVEAALAAAQKLTDDFEVIVVNDGSADGTAAVLEALRLRHSPHVRVVTHPENRGYGGALRSGLAAATKDYVFYTDGDAQYDPAEMTLLAERMSPGTVLVNGYKTQRSDPWHRILIGRAYNAMARMLFRIQLRDIDCDFRLFRRGALRLSELRSTGGTICVEIVRALERAGRVEEVPVSHYPRLYGRSQFFRLQSLATTFAQLCEVLIADLAYRSGGGGPFSLLRPYPLVVISLLIAVLTAVTYAWSFGHGLISDSYVQIHLGRVFGPVEAWGQLLHSTAYRTRATSIVLTYWTEQLFGSSTLAFRASSLLLHCVASLLVCGLGFWRAVGWRTALVAGCFFAVSQGHSEAVVWYAALPQLLAFVFTLAGFLSWVRFLQADSARMAAWAAMMLACLLALLSGASGLALVPLCVIAAALQRRGLSRNLLALIPAGLLSLAGAADLGPAGGTGLAGQLDLWGVVALIALLHRRPQGWKVIAAISLGWMVMGRDPYFASAGLALLVAAGLNELARWSASLRRQWLIPVAASLILLHQAGYLWAVMQRQYALRAEPTESLLRYARTSTGPVYASCFPYSSEVAEMALRVSLPQSGRGFVRVAPDAPPAPNRRVLNLCNDPAQGAE